MKTKSTIEVMARFDARGNVLPMQFTWQGSSYAVESIGRRWVNGDGEHILTLTPSGKTFELVYVRAEERWYLARSTSSSALA